MRHNKSELFNKALGEVIQEIVSSTGKSISTFAREYDFDRGNLSKITRGKLGCRIETVWKIAEAGNIDFTEFSKRLKNKLGNNFSLIDE